MPRRWSATGLICTLLIFAGHVSGVSAATKTIAAKRPITNPRYDPNGREVELFAAVEAGQVEARMIPRNSFGGTVFLENKTDKPLNVKVPDAVIAIPMTAQFGGGLGGAGLGGGLGGLGGGSGLGGLGGGQQALGGGFGGIGGGLGGGGFGGGGVGGVPGGGGGFFSIPPERTVAVTLNTVCLQHGRPDPTPSNRYRLLPVAQVSQDPVLHELLAIVATGKVDSQTAQAAAWTLSDNLSWQQLAAKTVTHLGGRAPTPCFTRDQLTSARQLLATASSRAARSRDQAPVSPSTPSTTQR